MTFLTFLTPINRCYIISNLSTPPCVIYVIYVTYSYIHQQSSKHIKTHQQSTSSHTSHTSCIFHSIFLYPVVYPVTSAMASDGGDGPKDDPETWSLPSVLGVRTSERSPERSQRLSASRAARPAPPRGGSRGGRGALTEDMAEIEAELLRGVSLSTALNGLGFLERILLVYS